MSRLPKSAYEWAIRHLSSEGDTDLFPRAFEHQALRYNWSAVVDQFRSLDVSNFEWSGGRRFIVPKDESAFRAATQLNPIDSVVLAAIAKKYGGRIEQARIPESENRVFSYRFAPQKDGRFYGTTTSWHDFWRVSLQRARKGRCHWVAVADVTDYYNQIYHHVVGAQLEECGMPYDVADALEKRFLGKLTHGVSRGIPVGPHCAHLIGECAMTPIDRSLLSHGLEFCRYVDDVHFFCSSERKAWIALYDFAEIVDKQQRLTLQKQKTRVVPAEEFETMARAMLVDRPMNRDEEKLLRVVKKHASDDPYVSVALTSLSGSDLAAVSKERLERLLEMYLAQSPRNYPRIGWLLRRLAQVGAPGAVAFALKRIEALVPVIGSLTRYLMAAAENYPGDLSQCGRSILGALHEPMIQRSEYLRVMLVNLYAMVPGLDHVDELAVLYPASPPSVRREIVAACAAAGHGHWMKERKDDFASSDPWLRRALVMAARCLPGDEGRHWLWKIRGELTGLEKLVVRWAYRDRNYKLGGVSLF